MSAPQTVVIDDGVIAQIGAVDSHESSAVQVDGTGKFLVPGLIDSHVHISTPMALDALASYGVTTAVNLACYNYTFCSALMSLEGTADMITASRPAIGTDSAHARLPLGDNPPGSTLSPGDNTSAWVETWAFPPESSASFLKVTAEPDGPNQELLNGVVAATHAKGYYAVMHASYLSAYEQAIVARPEGIQHIPADGIMPTRIARQIAAQDQFVTPTMAIFRVGANSQLLRQLLGQNYTWPVMQANLHALIAAGVTILAGTDSADLRAANVTMPYGFNLHCELEFLVEAGMRPIDALRAATALPAKLQNMYDRGVVHVGKRADLVLLNANPLVNISNTRDIARVWVAGVAYADVSHDVKQRCSQLNLIARDFW
ncbi:uncharacterized protein A1O9_12356 [Exophiala aquamarina CBS 119918]|uniref:Amidohydrolase-related domain-containing protein n=1 Tax=Exophiala aquamarina CBS 119918 TaxID=1182545 RepID=A0A072NVV1_9EURO|nr:uncharacterized protein A1O9_12356 [Exophiala aquamarina CBS 119918]KEF51721.1 hypothetical protein A1O9_12356 [Exophiala aquamarina CBS 119918]